MPCCDTGRNIQKYKGSAASTLQDVTDNSNTTTGDIITTGGFFIGDGSKLTNLPGLSVPYTFQEISDSGNTTSNTIQFTNEITSIVTTGDIRVGGTITASSIVSDNAVGLNKLNASNISTGTLPVARGGTNITTYAKGDILIASDTNTLSNLGLGADSYVLSSNSTSGLPEWKSPGSIGTTVATLNNGSYINGGLYNGGSATTWSIDATTTNTANKIVARDSNGDIFVSGVYGKIVGSNTINASTISTVSGMFGPIVGSNTINASTISTVSGMFGPIKGSNTISASTIYSTDFYGKIVGSNTINASTISTVSGMFGPIKGSNTISASTIYSTDFYGKIVGSNTINASTISTVSGMFGPIKGSNTITASSIVSDNAVGLNKLNASNISTGTLPVARGGTNITTYAKGDILIASDTNTLSNLGLGADSYVLSSNSTSGLPEWKSPGSIGTTVATLTNSSYIIGDVYNGDSATTWSIDATTTNIANKIVARDSNGNINVQKVSVGPDNNGIINTLSATTWSGSAAKLTTARTIGNVSFDGTININLPGVNTPGDQNTSGSAAKINVVDSASTSSLRVPFLNNDTGDVSVSSSDTLKYQASTGTLSSTIFNGSGSGLTSLNASNITSGKLSNIYGGTGFTTYTKGDLLVGTGFSPNGLRKLPIGQPTRVLTVNADGDIEWKPSTGGSSGGGGYWIENLSNIYYIEGNVGIGKSNPEYKLDVLGDINLTGFLHVNGSQGSIGQVLTSSGDGTMTWSTLSSMGGTSVWSTNCLNAYYNRGNVGVGTTNPIYKLHVVGNMKITSGLSVNNSYGQSGQVLTSGGGGQMSWTTISSGTIVSSDWLKNNSNIYYTAGSVGIGTSNPNYRLDVSGDIGLSGKIHSSDDATAHFGFINSSTSSGDDFVVTTNTFERMRVISSGNVGIGKTNPEYKLDVAGDINFTNVLRVNGSVGTSGQVLTSGGSEGATIWVFPDWKKNNSNIYYTTGNVGIGTSNPEYKLDVAGNMNLTSGLRVNNSYGESGQVLTSGGGGQMSWTTVSSGGSSVWTKNDTTAYYNTGNVAIGTTVANYTLNVAGNMNLTSGLRVDGAAGTYGQVLTSSGGGTMSWTTVSGGGTSNWALNGTNAYYNNGNVGIGKTNPEYKLDVVGNMNLTSGLRVNGAAGTIGQVLTSGGGGVMSWTSSPQFTEINLGDTLITKLNGVIQFGGETVRTGDVYLGTETSGNYVAAITGGNGISSTANPSGEGTTHTLSVDIKSNGGLIIENNRLAVDLGASAITGTLSNTSGGTGFTTYNQGDLLVGTSPSGLKKLQKGAAGYILTVNGTGSDIEWQASAGGNITINGNFVGISNVSPTHTLHIGSNVIVSDTGMDVLRVNGNVYTTNYFIGDGSKMSGITSIKNEFGGNKIYVGDSATQQPRDERYAERYAQIP